MTLTAPPPFDFEFLLPSLPEDAPARAQRLSKKAFAALQEGHYDEALRAFATFGTLKDVEGALYLSRMGMHLVWSRRREFSKALQVLEEALGLGNDRLVLLYIGVTLHQMERFEEALGVFDKVKESWPDDPDVWVYQMALLLALRNAEAALESAEHAFPLRHKSSDRGRLLYEAAAGVTTAMGLSALKRRSLPDYEKATDAFIKWRARARRDKQTAAFNQAVEEVKNGLPKEDIETFEDFMLGVRLMSIRDPFKGWYAVGKEISKHWPEGLSAVDAIREERD